MTTARIKYRVIIDGKKHYWGFLTGEDAPELGEGSTDISFVGPPTVTGKSIGRIFMLSKQFVNVCDKHGRELFVDDFFKLDSGPPVIYQVMFCRYFKTTESPEFIGVSLQPKGEPDEDGTVHKDLRLIGLPPEVTKEMVIVGNLDENPELAQPLLKEYML